MEDRVADTRQQRQHNDLPVGAGKAHRRHRQGHQQGAADQERPGAIPVDEKPHRGLHNRRGRRHHRHDQTELGKGDIESLLPGDEQRRQAELVEMRQEVARAEQQIDPGVAAKGEQLWHRRMLR